MKIRSNVEKIANQEFDSVTANTANKIYNAVITRVVYGFTDYGIFILYNDVIYSCIKNIEFAKVSADTNIQFAKAMLNFKLITQADFNKHVRYVFSSEKDKMNSMLAKKVCKQLADLAVKVPKKLLRLARYGVKNEQQS